MVKDTRTGHESGAVKDVLDGREELDGFISAWLKTNAKADAASS